MIERMKVYGVSKSKGVQDNGNAYDSAKIFSVARLKPSPNNSGFAGVQLDGLPAIYEKWLSFEFSRDGILFDVEFEKIAGRNGESSDLVVAMTLVSETKSEVEIENEKLKAEIESFKVEYEKMKSNRSEVVKKPA